MTNPSGDYCDDSTVCALVKQAIALETNYKEMLHQCDEVDMRTRVVALTGTPTIGCHLWG
jgi:hypothetical protein